MIVLRDNEKRLNHFTRQFGDDIVPLCQTKEPVLDLQEWDDAWAALWCTDCCQVLMERTEENTPELRLENIRGALYGLAFDANMYASNPDIPPQAVAAYKWAEKQFARLATEGASVEEAVSGYGG